MFIKAWNSLIDNREELIKRWERMVEFGNPLVQYRAIQFGDMAENVVKVKVSDRELILKVVEHTTVFESGKLV